MINGISHACWIQTVRFVRCDQDAQILVCSDAYPVIADFASGLALDKASLAVVVVVVVVCWQLLPLPRSRCAE